MNFLKSYQGRFCVIGVAIAKHKWRLYQFFREKFELDHRMFIAAVYFFNDSL